jgi:WD40 repeat protein
LPSTENYFQPKALYTQHKASLEHFQLRNLMSVTASNTFQYASRSRVYSVIPFYDESYCVMDLSDPLSSDYFQDPVKITVMAAKHGVSFAGGFFGEYAYRADVVDNLLVEGAVNGESTSITTHVDIVKSRTNSNPQAVIATNDNVMRVLDFYTNTFIHTHQFAEPVNCSDTSTDGRMRVITGDAPDAWVIDAETGKPIGTLKGHTDYGFACVWSPDMLHIATSNQDKTVKIWDSRMWRLLDTLESDVAGYRSLRYSPVGGGPRTLLMCEPADRIAIVNAQTYQTRQVHDFFGEVGGADFSPDGGRIWVANMDPEFGGFMEFDRATWSEEFGIPRLRRSSVGSESEPFYRDSGTANEWLREDELEHDGRCVLGPGERGLRFQRTMSNFLHDIHPYSG